MTEENTPYYPARNLAPVMPSHYSAPSFTHSAYLSCKPIAAPSVQGSS
jgi:hypothetical protein